MTSPRSRDPRRPGPRPAGRRPARDAPPRRRPAGASPPPPRRPRPAGGGNPTPPLRRTFERVDPRRRITMAGVIMGVVLLVFAGRLVHIQVFKAEEYASAAENVRLSTLAVPTMRGDITDAGGHPFAMSVEVRTVFVDPKVVLPDQRATVIKELSGRLGLDPAAVTAKVDAKPSRYQVVKKNVTPKDWLALDALDLAGIGSERDYKRVYPKETGAGSLVGFTGDDGHGLEGLEGVLEKTLAGEAGERQVEISKTGVQIPMADGLAKEPVPGKDVRLTLDRDIQWNAQKALSAQVEALDAEGGSVVVMRKNGEILAMADAPTFDPNEIDDSTPEERSNGAVNDAFEPGSTNKVITAAGALEEGLTTPDTVYTVPYSVKRYDRTFRDSHFHKTQRLTLNGIMAQSSNVGTIQVGEKLGAQNLYDYLGKFGFGKPTGLELPGENAGILTDPDDWWGTQLPSVSFGQGLSVNAVQMAGVYATIANDGVRVEPSVVAGTVDDQEEFTPAPKPKKERVIKAETADQLKLMLEAVTGEHGTAQQARIDGYRVAGKTGTANRINPETNKYEGGGYTSTFVGMAPAEDPELIVQVVLHNPKSAYYGGEGAAPVFTDVMSFSLKSEKVPPSTSKPPKLRLFEDE